MSDQPTQTEGRSHTLRAVGWMMGSLASFTAMALAGRELGSVMSTFELMTIRSVIGLAIISGLLCIFGWHHVRPNRLWLFGIRNSIHFGAQYLWFVGLTLLPLTEVFAIEFTQPIWVTVIAVLFLGERLNAARLLALALGIVGILVILRPGIELLQPGALVILGAAVGFAISISVTKYQLRQASPLAIVFYMALMQTPMGLIPALADWVVPTAAHWPWLVVAGVTGMSAHYCLARALSLADASLVIPMDFLRLPLIAVLGFLIYGEGVDMWVAAGAILVCTGNYLSVRQPAQPKDAE
jgi:drug/metabolite transporter (DMT)-like permease